MITVRRLMAVLAVLAFAAVTLRSPLTAEPARPGKDPNPPEVAPAPKDADKFLENFVAAKFQQDGVLTYKNKDDEIFFALKVQPALEPPRILKPCDYLVLVDTTASQAGPFYFMQRVLVHKLAHSLGADDRIAIWNVNTTPVNLTDGFVKGNDKKLTEALQKLDRFTPMGTADLKQALARSIEQFQNLNDRRQVVLYLGDGMSPLNPLSQDDRDEISRRLIARQAGFFPVPLGPQFDSQNLHGLASSTGGTPLRMQMQEKIDATLKRFKDLINVPVLYPTAFHLPAETTEFYPSRLPPLRADAPTLVVGKLSKPLKEISYSVAGKHNGKAVEFARNEKTHEPAHDCFFLVSMVEQWKNAKEAPALVRADRALAFAFDQMQMARGELMAQGRFALGKEKFDEAAALFEQAARIDPKDPEAKAALKLIDDIKKGKINLKKLEELANARFEGMLDPPKDPKDPNAPKDPPAKDDPLDRVRRQQLIEEQRLEFEVAERLKSAKANPPRTYADALRLIDDLKGMQRLVSGNPDIRDEVRRKLDRLLGNEIRMQELRSERILVEQKEREQAQALARAKREAIRQQEEREGNLQAAMAQFDVLMEQGRFMEALEQAKRAQALAPRAQVPDQAYSVAQAAYHLNDALRLIKEREDKFLLAMMQVERSHIPFPDEPPIAYAPASFYETKIYRNWQELSEKRIARWKIATFGERPSETALRLQKLMNEPTNELRNGFEPGTPLETALDFIGKRHNITIRIDRKAFEEEGGGKDIGQKPVSLPPMRNISLGTILRDLLSTLEPQGTYIIRSDHIEITTVQASLSEKTLVIHGVSDLVFPLQPQLALSGSMGGGFQFGGFQFGGLQFGQFGGIQFGQFGLQFGGFQFGQFGLQFGGIQFGGIQFGGIQFGGIQFGGIQFGGIQFGQLGLQLGGIQFGQLGLQLGGVNIGLQLGGVNLGLQLGGVNLGLQFGTGYQYSFLGGLQNPFGNPITQVAGAYLELFVKKIVGEPIDWPPDPQEPDPPVYPPWWTPGQVAYLGDPAFGLAVRATSSVKIRPHRQARRNMGGGGDGGNLLGGRPADPPGGVAAKPKDPPPQVASFKDDIDPEKLDPNLIWDAVFAGGADPNQALAAAHILGAFDKWTHAAELLKSAIKQGVVARPWMYEAIAAALVLSNGSQEEIERALLSMIDLCPNDSQGYLQGARILGKHKMYERALEFCRRAAEAAGNRPQPYLLALDLAVEARDAAAMTWAAGNLVGRDWPVRQQETHDQARRAVENLAFAFHKDGKADDARKLIDSLAAAQRRDLVIRVAWQGDAEVDLEVAEPSGSLCSFQHRQTPGGGTLFFGEDHVRTYSAAEAFSGAYKVTVRRVWGKPVGGKVAVEVIHHQGTPAERIERETILLDQPETLVYKFTDGRRKSLAQVVPVDVASELAPSASIEEMPSGIEQLRALANPLTVGRDASFYAGAGPAARPTSSLRKEAVDFSARPDDQVVFQGAVAPFIHNNVGFTTTAVVSADRRYVRLSVNANFQTVTFPPSQVPLFNNPYIPGFVRPY